MKDRRTGLVRLLIIAVVFAGCHRNNIFTITNPGTDDLIDLATVLSRAEVNQYLKDTGITCQVVAKDGNDERLPSQCDDLDGDGSWDEFVFLSDLEAGESKKVFFEAVENPSDFPVRTNIRFGRVTPPFEEVTLDLRMKTNDTKYTAPVYQMEGPAWENDLIAFRNYYDARNGIDIFGKRTTAMVLDSVGVNGRDYHTLADWGMDILKVGYSLGAGAIAIGIGDSLYRIGPCEEGRYRQISEGPVRAILELTYKGFPAGDRLYDVTHQISIYAGDRFYRSKVWISGLQGDEELVTGIVDLHGIPADTLTEGNTKILSSLGNQAYDGEVLGMAVMCPAGQFNGYREAPVKGFGIVNTHLVRLKLKRGVPAAYGFVAVWELQDAGVKEKEYFKELLIEAARKVEPQGLVALQ
jgi:hypothetical protein